MNQELGFEANVVIHVLHTHRAVICMAVIAILSTLNL